MGSAIFVVDGSSEIVRHFCKKSQKYVDKAEQCDIIKSSRNRNSCSSYPMCMRQNLSWVLPLFFVKEFRKTVDKP